ncbi:uncharacterized protein LOC143547658 [Bidens hawaiensis]|uniref:uncharacterized protein LOC143547658 n=1 Tax=Bidens hawaiensis TaxID=980011 RepID=UPI00404AF12F
MEIDGNLLTDHEDHPHDDPSWILPIRKYIQDRDIPKGENPKAFKAKVSQFTIIHDMLYKKYLAGPYLRCIEEPKIKEVLKDFHEGDCGNHTGGRELFSRILRTGYFWPTMKKDAVEYSKKCDACQRQGNIPHQPAEPLYPIVSS